MLESTEISSKVMELFLAFVVNGIPLSIITYFLGKWQSDVSWKRELNQREKEMQILQGQLEEQKKSRELAERMYQDSKIPKMPLVNWDFKNR